MKPYLVSVACIVLIFLTFPALGRPSLSKNQQFILQKAKNTGFLIGWPETIEAIVYQESSLGRFKIGDDGKSLGLAHVQVGTAKDVMKKNQWLPQFKTNYSIAKMLLHDDNTNLLIAAIYFQDCYDKFKNWPQALVCYNGGKQTAINWGRKNSEHFPYVIAIRKRLNEIHQLKETPHVQSFEVSYSTPFDIKTLGTPDNLLQSPRDSGLFVEKQEESKIFQHNDYLRSIF